MSYRLNATVVVYDREGRHVGHVRRVVDPTANNARKRAWRAVMPDLTIAGHYKSLKRAENALRRKGVK